MTRVPPWQHLNVDVIVNTEFNFKCTHKNNNKKQLTFVEFVKESSPNAVLSCNLFIYYVYVCFTQSIKILIKEEI